MNRYGLAAFLVLAAIIWPSLSDALIVGAGIVLALSVAVRRNARDADDDNRFVHGRLRTDGGRTSHPQVSNAVEVHLPLRYGVCRNELTGELLERSRLRVKVSTAFKRRHHRATPRSLLSGSLERQAGGRR